MDYSFFGVGGGGFVADSSAGPITSEVRIYTWDAVAKAVMP